MSSLWLGFFVGSFLGGVLAAIEGHRAFASTGATLTVVFYTCLCAFAGIGLIAVLKEVRP